VNEIWILGAAGRSGRAVAAQLAAAQLPLVLVGRDTIRLRELAGAIGGDTRIVTVGSVAAVVTEISRSNPAVVINTIGPFSETASPIVRACPPGTHYVDLANDLFSVVGLLGLNDEAVSSGRSLVTGVGFGVLATESVLLKLCEARPPAVRVRVDAVPMVEAEAGQLGSALAATIVDILATGGRQYAHNRLVRTGLGSHSERLTLPDGSSVQTGSGPSGELEAARRASGAPFVVAASSAAPTAAVVRAVLPAVSALVRLAAFRNMATRRIAGIRTKPQERVREFSWAHARVEWASGTTREGWLRAGEAMAFTAAVVAEVARRLALNEGRPGAFTPGALFGPDIAIHAGGQFILNQKAP